MEQIKLSFVNVGYGEAILLECPDSSSRDGVFVMVIDGGSGESAEYADRASGRIPLEQYMTERGITHVDIAISTHIHEDHLCGLIPVLQRRTPCEFWQTLPDGFYTQMKPIEIFDEDTQSRKKFIGALNDYRSLCLRLSEQGCNIRSLHAGFSAELCPGLSIRVLSPEEDDVQRLTESCLTLYSDTLKENLREKLDRLDVGMNNYSLILQISYQGTKLLLPGDTNGKGYGKVKVEDLRAHLFKIGHHGQRDGATPELLQCIAPDVVVCCASSDRRYNSADPQLLSRAASYGARLYFSDCPHVPGVAENLPPHHALEFSVGSDGYMEARYVF